MSYEEIRCSREELFDLVWAHPVRTVASRFGLSDVGLAKNCRKLHVPLPPRGYWAKVSAGQTVERPTLPDCPPGVPRVLHVTRQIGESDAPAVPPQVLARVAHESAPESLIVVPDVLERPHKLVVAARKLLRGLKPDEYGRVRCRNETCLDIAVAPSSLDRAFRFLDTFIKCADQRGYDVHVTPARAEDRYRYSPPRGHAQPNESRVIVEGVAFAFKLFEKSSSQRSPAPTPPKGMRGAELESWKLWNRSRLTHAANGRFEFTLKHWPADAGWIDTDKVRIESRLNEVFARLPVMANAVNIAEAEAEHQRLLVEAEERRRQEEKANAERERRRRELFGARIDRWRLAKDIREYVRETRTIVETSGAIIQPDGPLAEELAWALRYAEQLDPLSEVL